MDSDTDYIEVGLMVSVRVSPIMDAKEEGYATKQVEQAISAATEGVTKAIERAEREGFEHSHPEFSIKFVHTYCDWAQNEKGEFI